MKLQFKSLVLVAVAALCWSGLSAQSVFAIFGQITNTTTSNPIANHAVDIFSDSSFTGFQYYNTVYTDANGYYGDTITGIPPGNQDFYVSTLDCPSGVQNATVSNNQGTVGVVYADFTLGCTGTGGGGNCLASFSFQNDTISGAYFSDLSSGASTWMWDFGDNSTSTLANPYHNYTNPGTYLVCLTITDGLGCSDSQCDTVVIVSGNNCNALFSAYPDSNNGVWFSDMSTNATTWSWNFDDGGTSSQANPYHTYNAPGTYIVCLTTTNGNGCTSTYCDSIVVGNSTSCQANFSGSVNTFIPGTFDFTNSSVGNNLSYTWDFGDGTTSTLASPSHTYAVAGTYTVCLYIDDNAGCTDSFCMSVTYGGTGGNCDASFISFDSTGTWIFDATGQNSLSTTYTWDFGDNSFGTGDFVGHTYNMAGTYYVCLTVTDSTCSDTQCDTVVVGGGGNPCTSGFTFNASPSGTASFFGTSTGTAPFAYSWDFGDGGTSTLASPIHLYTNSGVYNACLTITDATGCTSTTCQYVSITGNMNLFIGGTVFASNNIADAGTVYLISMDSLSNLYAVDSTWIDSSGYYYFNNVQAGIYLVKAALSPNSTYYSNYLPTYFGDVLYWANASAITLASPLQNADINLVAGVNPGGPGFISGNVFQGANKTDAEGDPIEGIHVMLLDMSGNPVAHTISEVDGGYEFSNIAYGTYQVYADVPGKDTYPNIVTVDAAAPDADGINIIIGETEVTTGLFNVVRVENNRISNVYPNPVSDRANVSVTMDAPANLHLALYNAIGQEVTAFNQQVGNGTTVIDIPVSDIPAGTYFLRITDSNGAVLQTRQLARTR